jgi:hypothetical protein
MEDSSSRKKGIDLCSSAASSRPDINPMGPFSFLSMAKSARNSPEIRVSFADLRVGQPPTTKPKRHATPTAIPASMTGWSSFEVFIP